MNTKIKIKDRKEKQKIKNGMENTTRQLRIRKRWTMMIWITRKKMDHKNTYNDNINYIINDNKNNNNKIF